MTPQAEVPYQDNPSLDETPPAFGPNLAENAELCKEVLSYIHKDFLVPYLMQQERLWPSWARADQMWRAKAAVTDIDEEFFSVKPSVTGGRNRNRDQDSSTTAKVTPSAPHRQMDSILNFQCSISFKDGNLPLRAVKPDTVLEHPLYNPTQQGVDAANEIIRQNAKDINFHLKYRINAGSFVKYGHSWALVDYQQKFEQVPITRALPPDRTQAMLALQNFRQTLGQETSIEYDQYGRLIATWMQMQPKVMRTDFQHLDVDAVFVDQLIPLNPMERQPCPIIRTHITRWELKDNLYDAKANPFGWMNTTQAQKDQEHHYALSQSDEGMLRQLCALKYGLSDSNIKAKNTIKQLWTAWPLLAIDEKSGKLDTGDGVQCSDCAGKGTMTMVEEGIGTSETKCEHCNGEGKVYPKAERYIVQAFGTLYSGVSATCLRIQKNPTVKNRIPLLFAAHLVEDTAGCIPISKAEIAKSAYIQLATAHNQFTESKNRTINRPWLKRIDGPAWDVDCNQAGATIPWESSPNEAQRVAGNTFDETITLMPYMEKEEKEIRDIFGANETVLGQIGGGRRAASEVMNAFESSKVPIMMLIDLYNRAMPGGWGQFVLENIETFADRDWLRRKTGRTTWGKIDLFTAVGEEVLAKVALTQNAQYILQATAQDMSMAAVRPKLWKIVFDNMGLPIDMSDLDGGQKKAQMDAMKIVAQILGDGRLTAPSPSDPHALYISVFEEALKDEYWIERVPENMPLLMQRLEFQQQMLQMQQQQQMMQQMQMQAMQEHGSGALPHEAPMGNGDMPPNPPRAATSPGEQMQNNQGPRGQEGG